ncbi:L,D-transpeptidase family protein [Sulfurospirillum arcachonense]|uniref:L,D-transpeptidase family protein n=1 Tax=Sulfurospirillum arcachonense TaxID=57666 RepID=UPI00046848E3|nr:L,D-transpeptidase family protein [Sulfurospirillum arcachonense]
MYKLLVFVLLQTFLLANPVVDIYRDGGINAVEQYIKKQLQTKSYWEEKIETIDVSLGYYEDLDTLLIASKKNKELRVYQSSKNQIKHLSTYENVIVGADGDKYKEGDLKTPLGVYRIKQRFIPPDQFYGPLAFVLSYPNTFDKVQGKNGHGIWIHGSPLDGSPRDPMSKGCIVLDNNTIELLDKKIMPKNSITIVSENGIKAVDKSEISTILANLFQWKNAWKNSDIKTYLSFYSDEFKRYDGLKKKNFARMKKSIFARKEAKTIIFKGINISPYPNEKGKRIFKVSFHENYKTKRYSFNGNKELFVELNEKNFLILSEK